jgi:hypothetical protein
MLLSVRPSLTHWNALIDHRRTEYFDRLEMATDRHALSDRPIDEPANLDRISRVVAPDDDAYAAIRRQMVPGWGSDLPFRLAHDIRRFADGKVSGFSWIAMCVIDEVALSIRS